MSAPTANKYAEKWTYERTLDLLHAISRTSQNEDCLYLGQALETSGLYDDIWRYWQRKWHKQYEIIDIMKSIMQRFEVRLFSKMAKKEIPERVAMFALKHHYGWGKEPVEKINLSDELIYCDQQLVNERQERYNAEMAQKEAEAAQQLAETVNTEEASPDTRERVGHMTSNPKALLGADFKRKLSEYNQANPEKPVSRPAYYFPGIPPLGLDAIVYDGGYFVTPDMLVDALG
jgi:hypothetical protein